MCQSSVRLVMPNEREQGEKEKGVREAPQGLKLPIGLIS